MVNDSFPFLDHKISIWKEKYKYQTYKPLTVTIGKLRILPFYGPFKEYIHLLFIFFFQIKISWSKIGKWSLTMSSTGYPSLVNLSLNYTSSAIIVRFIYSYLGFFISLEGELVLAKIWLKFSFLRVCLCVFVFTVYILLLVQVGIGQGCLKLSLLVKILWT